MDFHALMSAGEVRYQVRLNVVSDGSTFAIGDRATEFEKNYTGNIEFSSAEARAAYIALRHLAYAAGDLQLIELTTYVGHLSDAQVLDGFNLAAPHIPAGIEPFTNNIVFNFPGGLEGFAQHEHVLPIVLLGHELGHLTPLPFGMHNSVLNAQGETLDGTYYENRVRAALGCPLRGRYAADIPACE